jgi:hypothetical protein
VEGSRFFGTRQWDASVEEWYSSSSWCSFACAIGRHGRKFIHYHFQFIIGHDVVVCFLKQNLVGPNLPRRHNGLYKPSQAPSLLLHAIEPRSRESDTTTLPLSCHLSVHPLFLVAHTQKTFGFHDTTVLMGREFMRSCCG